MDLLPLLGGGGELRKRMKVLLLKLKLCMPECFGKICLDTKFQPFRICSIVEDD